MRTGINFAGGFETLYSVNNEAEATDSLYELAAQSTGKLVVRCPGGAIAKLAMPYRNSDNSYEYGWGLREDVISNYYDNGGKDEDADTAAEAKAKWLRKASEQPDWYFIDKLGSLCFNSKGKIAVSWVVNVVTASLEDNIGIFQDLVNSGVNVEYFEMGNEIYSQLTFEEFIEKAEPIMMHIREQYPYAKIGIPVPKRNSPEKIAFFDGLSKYGRKDLYDAVIPHPYATEREMVETYKRYDVVKNIAYSESAPDPRFEEYCDVAFSEIGNVLSMVTSVIEGIKLSFSKEIWVTEFNSRPSNVLGNTIVNSILLYRMLVLFREIGVSMATIHNGVSPDYYGIISKTNETIENKLANIAIRRTGYYSLYAFRSPYSAYTGASYEEIQITSRFPFRKFIGYNCTMLTGYGFHSSIGAAGFAIRGAEKISGHAMEMYSPIEFDVMSKDIAILIPPYSIIGVTPMYRFTLSNIFNWTKGLWLQQRNFTTSNRK